MHINTKKICKSKQYNEIFLKKPNCFSMKYLNAENLCFSQYFFLYIKYTLTMIPRALN